MKEADPRVGFSPLRLAELRRKRGMTQRALANAAGVSQALIAELERGKHPPSKVSFEKIIAALGKDAALVEPTGDSR